MQRTTFSLLTLIFFVTVSFAQAPITFTNYTTSGGLLNDDVRSVSIDDTGAVWIATQGGVAIFDGIGFDSMTTAMDTGLVNNDIEVIHCVSGGDVWVGTAFGASRYNSGAWSTFTTADGLGHNRVLEINSDSQGNIWFGTLNGVSKFDGTNWTSWGQAEGLPFGGVNSITFDANGKKWFGTALGGVAIFDDSTFSFITTADGLVSDKIRSIAIDKSGYKWVGTSDGVTVLDWKNDWFTNHTKMYILPQPDTLNPVEDIELDTFGRPWVAVYVDYLVTEGGIAVHDKGTFTNYDGNVNLAGPVVRDLAISPGNIVYVATSTGLTEIMQIPASREDEMERDVVVYPNPVSTNLNVRYDAPVFEEIAIYNSQMMKVGSVQSNGIETNVDVSGFASGLFFLRSAGVTRRFVKL